MKAEITKSLFGSAVNLNSSPQSITGLLGDSYDYLVLGWFAGASGDSLLDVTLNADTTTNYRNYEMKGLSSTASAATGDADTAIELQNIIGTANPGLLIMKITGSSGDERYIDSFYSADGAILKQSSYWQNTADEVDEITFTAASSVTCDYEINLYRTPKAAGQAKWEIMKELSWSASSTEQSITSLLGDTDLQYRLDWVGDQELNIELNNDAGSNYTRQYLQNSGGTISAANSTTNTAIVTDGIKASVIINAESGGERLCTSLGSNTSAAQQSERAIWWSNTADELTGIYCTPAASATGTVKLYRKINSKTTADTLNFETIETVDISGDFSAGHTFSNLKGDSQTLYKMEFLGSSTPSNVILYTQFNGDTGANYSYQRLYGASGSTGAAAGTTITGNVTKQSSNVWYIYPKSGDNRPVLNTNYIAENQVNFYAAWWANSIDQITSIKCYGSSTQTITGTLKLSRLK